MHERINDILKKQERDDGAAARSDSEIEASVRREFVNGEELLAAAKARNVRLTDFFAAEQFPDLPVLPRRTADTFGIRKHTASQRPYLHTQDFYELIYVSRGRCAQTLPNSRPLLLQAGQAALLAPGCTHKLARARENDVIVKLVIPPPLYAAVSAPDLAETECVCVFTPRRETFEFFLWELLREQSAKDGLQTKTIPALLTLLFAELYRAREAQPTAHTDAELDNYLSEHLRDASLADFAAQQHYSAGYAGKRIRLRTGKSFSQAANESRLQAAARLLTETKMPIDAIASEVGYADPSGLYKQFTAAFGMTPGEYRRSFE